MILMPIFLGVSTYLLIGSLFHLSRRPPFDEE